MCTVAEVLRKFYFRSFSPKILVTANLYTSNSCNLDQNWRKSKALPENPNQERTLTDLPDYSFADGRPTPYGSKQKQRILKQREYTSRIIQLSGEIDFALTRHRELEQEKQNKVKEILDRKLKPKGDKLN